MTAGPTLVRTRADLAAALAAQDEAGGGRAVVMTMGALHEGHLALVRAAREHAAHVVVTIFVNPLQFGPAEDLARYPRDLDADLAALTGDGLLGAGLLGDGDVVFAPAVDEVYPGGEPEVRVSAGPIGTVLEGAARPGHLDGVLTVVLKLMHLTRPAVALFGRKDAQQLAAVRAMVRDLDVPVDVVAVPIVRESDGLARSSRNAYLSDDERARALALPRALAAGEAAAAAGGDPDEVRAAALAMLTAAPGVVVDYVALVDADTFEPVSAGPADGGTADGAPADGGPALLAAAVRVGSTRLIDNTRVDLTI